MEFEHDHISDVERIHQVVVRAGYLIGLSTCARIWEEYSDSYAAGWLFLPEDDTELLEIIKYKGKQMFI